jgi:hydroxylaminobenzene mutase
VIEAQQRGGVRHPDDPDPVESTKVVGALTLAVLGVMFSPFVGGVIPAVLALVLARQAEADIRESEGFLLGAGRLGLIRRLAWTALGVAAAVVVVLLLVWVVALARSAGESSFEGGVAAFLAET